MMKTVTILIVLFSGVIFADSMPRVFEENSMLDLTLAYDVNGLKKDKGDDRSYHPAVLSYSTPQGETVSVNVEIIARGKLRRQFLGCLVPPIRFKFDPANTKGTIFQGQTKIKMVTHCRNSPKFWQEYYMHEYLIYRIYNLLTDLSFRVRLVRMKYLDTQKKRKPFEKYGFLIENYKKMVKRNKAKTVKEESIALPKADFETSALFSVFQYMIGNTDWSIRSSHNTVLVTFPDHYNYFPVPYDFDFAGIINTHYAVPTPGLPIKSVRERLYRGFCKSEAQFKKTFAIFNEKKAAIYALYKEFPLLSTKTKKRALKYLDEFYKIIDSPKLVQRYFIENYRGRPLPIR